MELVDESSAPARTFGRRRGPGVVLLMVLGLVDAWMAPVRRTRPTPFERVAKPVTQNIDESFSPSAVIRAIVSARFLASYHA